MWDSQRAGPGLSVTMAHVSMWPGEGAVPRFQPDPKNHTESTIPINIYHPGLTLERRDVG